MNLYLGFDFGTSGVRAVLIDDAAAIENQLSYSWQITPKTNLAKSWKFALLHLIEQIPQKLRPAIRAIALDATSSTVLLCDAVGELVAQPLIYNDDRGLELLDTLTSIAPANHTVLSATSSLTKLLWFIQNLKLQTPNYYFLHQADWLAFILHGHLGISDYHNALKLGYDVENLCYPQWLKNLKLPVHLPKVLAPGTPIAPLLPRIAQQLGLAPDCIVCAGTTDSIAAFLATGAKSPGEAVTSLGSTLVLKLLSRTRIEDSRSGIYSHRLGNLWLVGGASNTGGAVLRHFFKDAELESLSRKIDVNNESLLNYYPLLKPGERFPINDPYLAPCIEPRPTESVDFLHGLLESMARIEAQGYHLLQQIGATPLTSVYSAGGGAKNLAWRILRGRHLQVPMLQAVNTTAAYGAALLARQGYNKTLTR
ncbi:MAG: FGGY-family carbohydrate kinase [Coleofasciculaceae cyanobacterium]